MRFFRKVSSFAISLIAVFLIISFSACSLTAGFTEYVIGSAVDFVSSVNKNCTMEKRAETKVLSGEKTELYINKNTGSVSLYDRVSGKVWNSLPDFKNGFAADYILSVFDGEKILKLDTSNCLAAKSGFSYKVNGKAVEAEYNLSAEDLSVFFSVTYTLNGEYIEVSIDTTGVVLSEGARLLSVSVLPYLGAVRYDMNTAGYEAFADYFVVPDGVGAIIRTAVEGSAAQMNFSVYGRNYHEDSIGVPMGAYGIKNGSNALSATVTASAENTVIKVYRSDADEQNVNRIYPEFIVTDISGTEGKVNISDSSFSDKFSVMYEPLTEGNADYVGIAASVRQALINESLINERVAESEYPLFVSVTGSPDGTGKNVQTSLLQAENLLSILKSKGINEVNMILEAFCRRGFDASSGSTHILSSVGGKKDLRTLTDYASKQNLRLFFGAYLLSDSSKISAATDINAQKQSFNIDNPLFLYAGDESYTRNYISVNAMSSAFSQVLGLLEDEGINGLCVLDTQNTVISDYSKASVSATGYNSILSQNFSAARVNNSVMTNGFSLNTAKLTDYIKSVSFETKHPEDVGYSAVPFIPVVIHASCIYSGEAANTFTVPKLQLLKSIEYGAVPYYSWVFNSYSDKYYELTLNEAVDFYNRAKSDLGDLSTQRIVAHFEFEGSVYCTVYENGAKVYVNYNNYSVLLGEVSVLPYDYLRIG